MTQRKFWLGCLLVLAGGLCAAQTTPSEDLVVHEWGTFLAMNGSDGVTLDGMYHEEHALPAFVHARSREQLQLHASQLKGETPVIYFYTHHPQQVEVTVRFPQGVWTQWYPQASYVGPSLAGEGTPLQPRNGRIGWSVDVIPAEQGAPTLPVTARDALWNYARDVNSAFVKISTDKGKSEYERFLFYRGLGRASLPLAVSAADGGTLSLSAANPFPLKHLFVLRVENGRGAYRYLSRIAPGETLTHTIPEMVNAQPLTEFSARVADDLAQRLTESGLYTREARAMVNTWRTSYFQSDGIRVLYVLPQEWTDSFIPMEISPIPDKLVRVMVGRTELLTSDRERQMETAVRQLAAPQTAARLQAFDALRAQGRYVEPILRRTMRVTQDRQVREICERLLLTDWVQELRTAVRSAANGAPVVEDPLYIRAQLASVLRQAGLEEEAQAEGEAVWNVLLKHKAPPMTSFESRQYLRARARACEAMGDDVGAAREYATFIQFGSQVKGKCGSCHDGRVAPRDMAWFHDWYVGRKFAEYTARTGRTDTAIAEQKADLARHPDDTAAQMKLAYLEQFIGKATQADELWAQMEEKSGRKRDLAEKRFEDSKAR